MFNDLRYAINTDKMRALGWSESVPWEEGLAETVSWYKDHPQQWANMEQALVAHPRIGSAFEDGVDDAKA